jgi:hypothetical protein
MPNSHGSRVNSLALLDPRVRDQFMRPRLPALVSCICSIGDEWEGEFLVIDRTGQVVVFSEIANERAQVREMKCMRMRRRRRVAV